MSKSFLFKFVIALSFLAAAVLWLLSLVKPETFGFFNLSWALVMGCGVTGIALMTRGLFSKKLGLLKKGDIWLGAIFAGIAAVSVVTALAAPKSYVWPVIAIVAAFALVISLIATGGKKWDEGDNTQVGYKDYWARRKEAEAREAEEEKRK